MLLQALISDKRSRFAEYLQPLLLAAITVAVAYKAAAIGVDAHHDGIVLKPALDLADGKMLFRDTFSQYGALTTLLQTLALEIFGRRLIVLKLETAFFYAASLYFLWLAWKRLVPQWLASACGAVYIALLPIYSGDFFPWSSVFALFFLSVSVYLLLVFCGRRAWYAACAAGISTALTLWCRQPVGAALFLAVSFFFACEAFGSSDRRPFAAGFKAFLAGFLAVNALFLCWIVLNGALKDMWLQSVVFPFLWAADGSKHPGSLSGVAGILFPSQRDLYPYYVWSFLPSACLFCFAGELYACLRAERRQGHDMAVFAVSAVCLASWAQYYPSPDAMHVFWAAAPMLGLFGYCALKPFMRLGAGLRALLVLSLLGLFFYPDAALRLGARRALLAPDYTTLTYPEVLSGMKVPPRNALTFRAIASAMDGYFAGHPGGSLVAACRDALYPSFADHVYNFGPPTVQWPDLENVYPDYRARSAEFSRKYRPLIISDDYPVIHDGYTIAALAWQKGTGLMQRIYVSVPGEPAAAWYITDLRPVNYDMNAWKGGTLSYALELQFSSSHARELASAVIAAYGADGRLNGAWRPVSRTEDSLDLRYAAGTGAGAAKAMEKMAIPSGGRLRLTIDCPGPACLNAARLGITTVTDDRKVFRRDVNFVSPALWLSEAPPGLYGLGAAAGASAARQPVRGMALVPGGTFAMGSPAGRGGADEHPRHKVELDAFFIDKCEVSAGQYAAFAKAAGRRMPPQPAWSGGQYPVVGVDWFEAQAYCAWAGKRLPTEAEWEKAARGGTSSEYSFGDDQSELEDYAWDNVDSGRQARPAGLKRPNGYGLYDMQGNAAEWVSDWYDAGYYGVSPAGAPEGPASGKFRVIRGGSWRSYRYYFALNLRVADRNWSYPVRRSDSVGFRCASPRAGK